MHLFRSGSASDHHAGHVSAENNHYDDEYRDEAKQCHGAYADKPAGVIAKSREQMTDFQPVAVAQRFAAQHQPAVKHRAQQDQKNRADARHQIQQHENDCQDDEQTYPCAFLNLEHGPRVGDPFPAVARRNAVAPRDEIAVGRNNGSVRNPGFWCGIRIDCHGFAYSFTSDTVARHDCGTGTDG